MFISVRSVTGRFFVQKLFSHIDKNSEGKFEDMFLVKIANKGTSLRSGNPVCLFIHFHYSSVFIRVFLQWPAIPIR